MLNGPWRRGNRLLLRRFESCDGHRSQDHDQRIDRPEVIRFRMRDVVRERKKEQNNREPGSQAGIALVEPAVTQ